MRAFTAAVAVAGLALIATPSAALTDDFGVDIYMSAPTVQGTAVSTGLTTEDFNSASTGACPASIAIGALSGGCAVSAVGTYGGATAAANVATPTTGGAGSNYASTANPSMELSIDLTEPAKYLGLWWSAGSPSNVVELYSEGELVASMATATLMDLLATGSATSIGGTLYDTDDYNGNPRNNALAAAEPFLYLNLYATGGASFDQIVLSGGGFEFDNIAVSDLPQEPADAEVGIEFIPGENAPVVEEEEELAATGFNAPGLVGLGLLALAAGVAIVRRRTA